MKKQLFALLALTTLFASSCSKDDDNGTSTGPSRLMTAITDADGWEKAKIVYNDDKTIKSYELGVIYLPKYENGKIVSINYTNDPEDQVGILESILQYDTKGRVRKINSDSLVYNSSNQLIEFYHDLGNSGPWLVTKLTWDKGNVVKALQVNQEDKDTSIYTYKYDNKRNVFAGVFFAPYHMGVNWEYHSANNATEVLWEPLYNGTVSGAEKTITQYLEYNSDNYPVKVKVSEYYNNTLDSEDEYTISYLPKS